MFYVMGNNSNKSTNAELGTSVQFPRVSDKTRVTLVNVTPRKSFENFSKKDQLKKVEYVPSMNDIRAQRAVKLKLQVLEKEARAKTERQKEEKARQEKLQMKDREKELKMKQRNEIYALNKAMTELEFKRFQEFCARKGISIN